MATQEAYGNIKPIFHSNSMFGVCSAVQEDCLVLPPFLVTEIKGLWVYVGEGVV